MTRSKWGLSSGQRRHVESWQLKPLTRSYMKRDFAMLLAFMTSPHRSNIGSSWPLKSPHTTNFQPASFQRAMHSHIDNEISPASSIGAQISKPSFAWSLAN